MALNRQLLDGCNYFVMTNINILLTQGLIKKGENNLILPIRHSCIRIIYKHAAFYVISPRKVTTFEILHFYFYFYNFCYHRYLGKCPPPIGSIWICWYLSVSFQQNILFHRIPFTDLWMFIFQLVFKFWNFTIGWVHQMARIVPSSLAIRN